MRLGTFWRTFFNSITNPKYYVDILNVRLWFSVRFLICSYIVLTALATLIFVSIEVPRLHTSLTGFLSTSVHDFPPEQKITWDGLKISTTDNTSYSLPFPNLAPGQQTQPRLIEIDPTITDVNQIQQSESERSLVFVGQKSVFVAQPGGGWQEMALTDTLSSDEFSITKESLESSLPMYQERLQSTLRALPFIFMAFFFFILFPFRIFNVLLDTIIIYFMVKMLRLPLGWKKVVQITLHITVAAELLSTLTANFANGLPMFSYAFWAYTGLVYWSLRNIKAVSPIEAERLSKE